MAYTVDERHLLECLNCKSKYEVVVAHNHDKMAFKSKLAYPCFVCGVLSPFFHASEDVFRTQKAGQLNDQEDEDEDE